MELTLTLEDNLQMGLFILNKERFPYKPFMQNDELFLTQENNSTLKKQILQLISEAEKVLKVCSFILTDNEIFQALLKRVKQNEVAVFVLTQLDPGKLKNTLISDLVTEEELKEDTAQNHLAYIKMLYDHGAHVRAATTAHAKFIIVDRQKAMIMSANLTTPSLNFNTESAVYLDAVSATDLDRLFDIIFQHGTRYRQYHTASKKKAFVVQKTENVPTDCLTINPMSQLCYTYEQYSNQLYKDIVKLIKSAKQFVYLSSYSIVGLHKLPEFMNELKRAIERNVEINIFCRGMNYRSDHLESCKTLHLMGCKIYGDLYNHSKGIINENKGLIFTANIDGNHGLINGFEVGCILNPQQRQLFLEFHIELIKTSFYIFENRPSRRLFFETYSAYEAMKNNFAPQLPEELFINNPSKLRINYKDFEKMPLFFSQKGQKTFLFVGRNIYRCEYDNGQFSLLFHEEPQFDLERYLLTYTNLKLNLN